MALVPREIEREARRLLRRLLRNAGFFAPEGEGYRFFKNKKPLKGRAGYLTPPLARAFLERGWLRRLPDGLHLTEEGARFLRQAAGLEDPIRARHQIVVRRNARTAQGEIETVTVNQGESPLGWLLHRKGADGRPLIGEEEYAAGERLREDFTRAHLNPRVTSDWTRPIGDLPRASYGAHEVTMAAHAARRRVHAALQAVGPGLAGPLVAVCCRLEGLEAVEKAHAWPRRAGKIVLKIALERLARHYGIVHESARPARLRAWRAEGEEGKKETA